MFVLLLSAAFVGLVYSACPAGWEADGNKCYLISRDNQTMPGALTVCSFLKATLARVENKHVQDFLVNKLEESKYSDGDAFWIDANDFEQEDVWVDFQGNPITYTNWGPGQPNNQYNSESCVVIRRDYNFNYKWSDNHCDEEFYYICEKSSVINPGVVG